MHNVRSPYKTVEPVIGLTASVVKCLFSSSPHCLLPPPRLCSHRWYILAARIVVDLLLSPEPGAGSQGCKTRSAREMQTLRVVEWSASDNDREEGLPRLRLV